MSQGKPSVSVIMPVYNEFRTLSDMVSDIILFNSKKYDLQIIIIESIKIIILTIVTSWPNW
jgi:hypothetical protein